MAITEALPLGVSHGPEDGVLIPGEGLRLGRESREDAQQFAAIVVEVGGRSAGDFLIPLGARRETVGPWKREPECKPAQGWARNDAGSGAHGFLAHAGAKDIGEMANHLVRGHGTPAVGAGGLEGLEAPENFFAVGGIGEGLHDS